MFCPADWFAEQPPPPPFNLSLPSSTGTPYYMSPEIWSKIPYDDKSDMWALGCVLFELCSLQPPFLAKDVTGLAQKVKTAPTPQLPRHFSSDLQTLVHRLLGTSPHHTRSSQGRKGAGTVGAGVVVKWGQVNRWCVTPSRFASLPLTPRRTCVS